MPFLEGLDLVNVLQGQTDIVEAVEQTVLAKAVHFEIDRIAIWKTKLLSLQVHVYLQGLLTS